MEKEAVMPSPFPGVDPYLESQWYWPDFHATFLNYWCNALFKVLPSRYEARIDERMLPEGRTTYIRIQLLPHHHLVAVLELLTPEDKEEPGYSCYCTKRNAVLQQSVHLIEVDLLHGGKRPDLGRSCPAGDYCALIADADHRPHADVYSWTIRQPLPPLPIPLLAPDPAVCVDLAAVYNTTFDRGRYAPSIDYTQPPTAVTEADREWAVRTAQPPANPVGPS
jgi:hypothetical protein